MRSPALLAVIAGVAMLVSTMDARAPARPPNELGRVPIFEYHKIDVPEARWTRTPEHFRADLQRLWDGGYRLIALADVLHDHITTPAGMTPVVLTLDDSSPGQFRFIEEHGEMVIDPNCAVGILERFDREHPGFGHAATFYVLPGASPPNKLFNQPALAARKLQYLASHGYEIGNHTLWHAELSKYPEAVVRRQLAMSQREIERAVPGYRLHTLALPLGAHPKDTAWAISGSSEGVSYQNEAILEVAGPAARSPYDRLFDPYKLPRVQGIDSDLHALFTNFDRHPDERFVSDGNAQTITIPTGTRDRVAPKFAARVVEH
jgi:peptidoglycan/xylan/chitin deacetylase (PgdA/CDA1 family)